MRPKSQRWWLTEDRVELHHHNGSDRLGSVHLLSCKPEAPPNRGHHAPVASLTAAQ